MNNDEAIASDEQEWRVMLEDITFTISHGIRGPIATMLGLLELIKMDVIQEDEMPSICLHFKRCIAELDKNCNELGAIIYKQRIEKLIDASTK